jgi:hypothetical protein
MRVPSSLTILVVSLTALSGCATTDGPTAQVNVPDEGQVCLEALVVDEELLPIPQATVTVKGLEAPFVSDEMGKVVICPIQAGDYELGVEKAGYAAATQSVSVLYETVRVTLTLKAVALDVPYHQSQHHVTFVICASYNPVGGVPCTKLVDYVAGTNVSNTERFAFTFKIPNANLADMLVEMTWVAQNLGKDALFYIQTPPGQPATAVATKYFAKSGGNPIRGWVTAGIKNRCGTSECAGLFDAEPNKVTYEGTTVWSDGNATIPRTNLPSNPVLSGLSGVSVYLNHRVEVWMTMFYNREGSRDFTALPDK